MHNTLCISIGCQCPQQDIIAFLGLVLSPFSKWKIWYLPCIDGKSTFSQCISFSISISPKLYSVFPIHVWILFIEWIFQYFLDCLQHVYNWYYIRKSSVLLIFISIAWRYWHFPLMHFHQFIITNRQNTSWCHFRPYTSLKF